MEAYIRDVLIEDEQTIVLFSGCDYKCRFCNTPQLLEQKAEDLKQLRDIKTAIDQSGRSVVKFTGGEPLLQRLALLELLKHCKAKSYSTIVETNASKPDAIRTLLDEQLVNELIVDFKAPRTAFNKVTRAATFFKTEEELADEFAAAVTLLKKHRSTKITFRTIVTPGVLYRKEELLAMAHELDGFGGEWSLVPFSAETTLDPTLRGVSPPTYRFLETLIGFIKKERPKLNVVAEE